MVYRTGGWWGRVPVALCVVGSLGLFLDWGFVGGSAMGFRTWEAGAIGALLGLVTLFLVATETRVPLPLWRPIVTFSAGTATIVLFLVYVYASGGLAWTRHAGPWVTLTATLGLQAHAALDVRALLGRGQQD